jgi:hypothetical protein
LDVDACIGQIGRVEWCADVVLDTGRDIRNLSMTRAARHLARDCTPTPTTKVHHSWRQLTVQHNEFSDQRKKKTPANMVRRAMVQPMHIDHLL